jgi:predicted permease
LSTGSEPEQIFVELVTGNYFDLLGIRPALGRFFLPEEGETWGKYPVAVMGHGLWARRFGSDPGVLGTTVRMNGSAFTVVGIAPEGFKGLSAIFGPDFWVPTMMYRQILPAQFQDWFERRRLLFISIAGRLEPDVSIEEAEANMKTIASALEQEYPEPNGGRSVVLLPLAEATIFPGIRGFLVLGGAVLMVVVGLVLLIACSNVANLLLARAAARRKEVAIRLAIGAGRSRLIGQLLTEATLLALMGGIVGLFIAYWGRSFIWSMRPPFAAQVNLDLPLDSRVLGFTLLVSLGTGIVFGLVPALRASRPDVVEALKEETRTGGGKARFGLRNLLVVAQVALSVVSLVAGGLFLRSLASASEMDPGFEVDRLAVMTVSPGQQGFDEPQAEQFYDQVIERTRTLPGLRSAAWASNLPLFGGFSRSVFPEGQGAEEEGSGVIVQTNSIGPEYFDTFGITVARGRRFNLADREDSVPVAIINEAMAERFWPGEEALGKRFKFYGDDEFQEVIGIVETVKIVTLGEDPRPCAYLSMKQRFNDTMTLYLRSEGEPGAVSGTARREVRTLAAEIPITNVWTISEVIDQSLFAPKLGAALLAVLGLLALALASVRLYGLMAYTVNQRDHEIGLRMALGARRGDVLRLILKQAMTLVGIGMGIGVALSLAVTSMVSSLLYGISPADPATFLGVTTALVTVAFLAVLVPAHRATRVDPLVALRYE